MIKHPSLDLSLDTIKHSHRDQLLTWRNNPEIFKWCRQNDLLTDENHKRWFDEISVSTKIKMFSIYESDVMVGVCGLTDIDLINQRAEFSLYIGPEFQGQGIGKDALQLLCLHGFSAYPLNVIWGESYAGNPAIKMFQKIGFKEEGVRRDFYFRNGCHIDAVLFSIKRDEFVL